MLRRRLLFLNLAAAGLVGCNQPLASPPQPKEPIIAAGEIGSRLPDFSVKDLQGREISSAHLRGKVVLIDFWATWCQPCKKEMPGYQKLLDRYGSRGFVVVGFKFDTMMDMEDPILFAKEIGVRYPLAIAADELKQKFGGIEGLPTTMLYDREGILRKKVIGFEYTDAFEADLKPLLDGGRSPESSPEAPAHLPSRRPRAAAGALISPGADKPASFASGSGSPSIEELARVGEGSRRPGSPRSTN